MPGALHGLKVIDCTHVIAGAWCSMQLADLGADVVKIEPLGGEVTRSSPFKGFHPFDFVNRNKRMLAVDISTREGAELVRSLTSDADVFVENFRPGAMARAGLGYEDLSALNPGLVYASISGFGQSGPYRERGGFDLVAQAMSGIMSLTGEIGAQRPVSAGVPLSDLNAGLFAAIGVLAALQSRHRTGEGQYVETSLLESAMAYTVWESGMALTVGGSFEPAGSRHRLAAPYEALKTRDGFLVVGVANAKLWRRFCEALGAPKLIERREYCDNRRRVANRDALQAELEAILAHDTADNWVCKLTNAGVPCGPISTVGEALEDPQIRATGFIQQVGDRRFPRTPLSMSRTPVRIRRGAGRIGADTSDVLIELGLEEADVRALAAREIVKMDEPA